jgi:hypothetical protein
MTDKFCIYCGKPLAGAMRFCTKCGKPVAGEIGAVDEAPDMQYWERLANNAQMQAFARPAAKSTPPRQAVEAAWQQLALPSTPDPEQILYDRVPEPKQNAFTVLVPRGWKTRGGMFYVNPLQVNGPGNAMVPKCDFAIMNDDLGTMILRWMPSWNYADLTCAPAQSAHFPPGQWYQGMPVRPVVSARQFLWELLQAERPGASGMKIVLEDPLNDVTAAYYRKAGWAGQNLQHAGLGAMKFESCDMRVEYAEQGQLFWEEATTTIRDNRSGANTWTNENSFMLRAPAAAFATWLGVLLKIRNSLETNSQWLAAVEQASGQHAKTAWETQQYINQVAAAIIANRQKAYEEAQKKWEEEPKPPKEDGEKTPE